MPLPKQQTNWVARLVVLLILGVVAGLFVPLSLLLHALHAPDLVVYPAITFWVVLMLYTALWTISVWAPVRGRKIVDRVLKTPWLFG